MMRFICCLLMIFCCICVQAQLPGRDSAKVNAPAPNTSPQRTTAAEICGNALDDDGNGLRDCDDFSCYFLTVGNACSCVSSNLIWIGSGNGDLIWVDMNTRVEKKVGTMLTTMGDITWTPSGKLYGLGYPIPSLWEINPADASTVNVIPMIPGFTAANAMTSDAAGNLYISAMSALGNWSVIKMNPATGAFTTIADLTAAGLFSGGDLAFSNGFLYAACANNRLGKINTVTGAVQNIQVNGLPLGAQVYGIVSVADGSLFLSDVNRLYKLNVTTMEATNVMNIVLPVNIYGMANYNDNCNAPVECKAAVKISIESPLPYCSAKGVTLKATGSGTLGEAAYDWIFPDGSTKTAQTIVVNLAGKYKVRYHSIPDTCSKEDSLVLTMSADPDAGLGKDTFFCRGGSVILKPLDDRGVISYKWQDGSTGPQFTASTTGLYWLTIENICGVATDTIRVDVFDPPKVQLQPDSTLCYRDVIALKNLAPRQSIDQYTWSNGSNDPQINITTAGTFWLESVNTCGNARDEVIIAMKDTCVCLPLMAKADIGPDQGICVGDTIQLVNLLHDKDFRYRWNTGSTDSTIFVDKPGTYSLQVETWCNTAMDEVVIYQLGKEECECRVNVPNAFTPNNDGHNDVLKALFNCNAKGQLRIYNRWGQLVFSTNDFRVGWDGKVGGNTQATGVFVYYVTYTFPRKQGQFSQKGTINLIR